MITEGRIEGSAALGECIVERALRIRQLDKISPGSVTRMTVRIEGHPYEIFVRVQPTESAT